MSENEIKHIVRFEFPKNAFMHFIYKKMPENTQVAELDIPKGCIKITCYDLQKEDVVYTQSNKTVYTIGVELNRLHTAKLLSLIPSARSKFVHLKPEDKLILGTQGSIFVANNTDTVLNPKDCTNLLGDTKEIQTILTILEQKDKNNKNSIQNAINFNF